MAKTRKDYRAGRIEILEMEAQLASTEIALLRAIWAIQEKMINYLVAKGAK